MKRWHEAAFTAAPNALAAAKEMLGPGYAGSPENLEHGRR
jgi:hypothetical protein